MRHRDGQSVAVVLGRRPYSDGQAVRRCPMVGGPWVAGADARSGPLVSMCDGERQEGHACT